MDEQAVLDRHLERWRGEGLVDAALEARLRSASAPLLLRAPTPWVRWALALLGGGLLLAGLILIIAENWAAIPRWGKLSAWGALHLTFLAGAEEARRRFERPFLAETFAFVAGGWLFAGIALVSQIYHLTSRPANGFWLWFALVLPLAWILRQKATSVVAFAALTAALTAEVSDPRSWVGVPRGAGGDAPWLWLAVPLLALFVVSWLPQQARWLRGSVGLWAFASSQVALLVLGARQHLDNNVLDRAWAVAIVGFAVALGWPRRTLPEPWSPWGARSILALTFLPWVLLGRDYDATVPLDVFAIGVAWVVQIVVALLLIRVAARAAATLWVNLGFLALLIGILVRYFDFFGNFLEGGTALALTGLLILAIVAILERARRRTLLASTGAP